MSIEEILSEISNDYGQTIHMFGMTPIQFHDTVYCNGIVSSPNHGMSYFSMKNISNGNVFGNMSMTYESLAKNRADATLMSIKQLYDKSTMLYVLTLSFGGNGCASQSLKCIFTDKSVANEAIEDAKKEASNVNYTLIEWNKLETDASEDEIINAFS